VENQFQPVTDRSILAVIEMVDVALRSYFMNPANEPKLTNPDEVQEAIRGLRVSKAPGQKQYPEQGTEASPTASSIPPGPDFQCNPPHPSIPYSMEVRSNDLYT
jgi:hypothetical protein